MAERLSAAGFRAILVDHAALPPDADLSAFERVAPRLESSPQSRWTLHPLAPSTLEPSERTRIAFGEPLLTFDEGISYREDTGAIPYRWASRRGSLAIHNLATHAREVVVTFRADAAVEGEWQLSFAANGATSSIPLDEEADELYRIRLTVPPGRTSLRFETTAPRLDVPADSRVLVFRLIEPAIDTVDSAAAVSG